MGMIISITQSCLRTNSNLKTWKLRPLALLKIIDHISPLSIILFPKHLWWETFLLLHVHSHHWSGLPLPLLDWYVSFLAYESFSGSPLEVQAPVLETRPWSGLTVTVPTGASFLSPLGLCPYCALCWDTLLPSLLSASPCDFPGHVHHLISPHPVPSSGCAHPWRYLLFICLFAS